MRSRVFPAFVFLIALTLAGCSAVSAQPVATPTSTPTSEAMPTAVATPTSAPMPTTAPTAPTATTVPGAAAPTAVASAQPTVSAGVSAAIQAVIQKANDEQQQAFAKNDPTIMTDTATSDYYDELVKINSDMSSGGVTGIKLTKIEWGPITQTDATTVQTITYETWQTTFSDGSTDQSRDENVYVLVQEQGAWKIKSDDHPNSNPNQPANPTSPAPSASVPPSGQTDVSRNWSGYSATGGTFTGVSGTWTVPESNGSGTAGGGATWVGIGGAVSRDLIQAGTDETSDGSGTVHYEAWIETLPAASQAIQLTVRPGDSVTVSINQQATDQWSIVFQNNTTGQVYKTNVQYSSSLSSVEWVVEAPVVGRRVIPLDDFGTIQFTAGSAVLKGKTVSIAGAGAGPITMLDAGGNSLAAPSALTADGAGFSVSKTSAAMQPATGLNGQR